MTRKTNALAIGKYIDPMVDYGFKYIFKESGKKQLLIRPLNEIFGLNIVDITIDDGEQLGHTQEDRKACFDLFCKTRDGRQFVIEVQIAQQKYFLERSLFYTTFPISKSAPKDKDEREKWDFDYPPVFFFGLLNFGLRHLDPSRADKDQFIHLFTLRDEKTGELMTERLRFAFLEVRRFNKKKEDCHTFEDRFLFMLKNLPTFAEKPELWDDPYFDAMIQEAEYANMTDAQQMAYLNSLMARWDYANTIDFAREEGKQQQAMEVARRMKEKDRPIEEIVEFTDLTEEQIRAL